MYYAVVDRTIEDLLSKNRCEYRRRANEAQDKGEDTVEIFKETQAIRSGLLEAKDKCGRHLPIRCDDVGDDVWQMILNEIIKRSYLLIGDNCNSPHDYHIKLCESAGCNGCPEYGNNGCGSRIIRGIEFDGCDDDETIVSINNNSDCAKQAAEEEKQKEYQELQTIRKQMEDGIHVFSAAIKEALRLMPEGYHGDCYGDIVRSAAAVACSQGKDHA